MSDHLNKFEEVFEQVAYEFYAGFHESMYTAALKVCPDLLLHQTDEYMAGIVNKLINVRSDAARTNSGKPFKY